VAIRLEVCVLLLQGPPTSQRPRTTFLTVLPRRATSYTQMGTHEHHPISSSHTYFCLARFIVNITHQHDNDRTLKAIYCCACYFVGFLVYNYIKASWN